MRPYRLHLCILAALMIPGTALFIMETLSSQTGGVLFRKYDASKLYWLGLIGYSIISTSIVSSLNLFFRIKKRGFSKKAVMLSHLLPVVAVGVFIQLGLHDLIQNIWRDSESEKKNVSRQVHKKTDRQKLRIPRAPLSKPLIYQQSGNAIASEKQSAVVKAGNKSEE